MREDVPWSADGGEKIFKQQKVLAPWHRRKIIINPSDRDDLTRYPDNTLRTNRYRWWNFLPLDLWRQMHRRANIWFVAIAILQMLPFWTPPIHLWGNLLPLLVCFTVTLGINCWDDYCRYLVSQKVNSQLCRILCGENAKLMQVEARQLRVGNVVQVSNDTEIPADMVLLNCANKDSCMIDTSGIRGKAKLEKRVPVKETKSNLSLASIAAMNGAIMAEVPSADLETFNGYLKLHSHPRTTQLTINNLVFRGSILRQAKYVYGVVIYTGPDTRQARCGGPVVRKTSITEGQIDTFVFFSLGVILIASLGSAVRSYLFRDVSTLVHLGATPVPFWKLWISFIVLYSNMIPITLMASLDVARLVQALVIEYDAKMSLPSSSGPRRTIARTSALNETLGQVDFIFADKTGTLTKNRLKFAACFVDTKYYGPQGSHRADSHAVENRVRGHSGKSLTSCSSVPNGLEIENNLRDLNGLSGQPTNKTWLSVQTQDEGGATQPHNIFRGSRPGAELCSLNFSSAQSGPRTFGCGTSGRLLDPRKPAGSARFAEVSEPIKAQVSLCDPAILEDLSVDDERGMRIHEFLLACCLCTDVSVVYGGKTGSRRSRALMHGSTEGHDAKETRKDPISNKVRITCYESADPVDVCIASGASRLGYRVLRVSAKHRVIEVNKVGKKVETYCSGTPTKKLMFVIIREFISSTMHITLYVRGSPASLMPYLTNNRNQSCLKSAIKKFAYQGMRGIIFAKKQLTVQQADAFKTAKSNLRRCAKLLSELQQEDMELVGMAGIEDTLCDRVPQTIERLLDAGVRMWLLTGDETSFTTQAAYRSRLIGRRAKIIDLKLSSFPKEGMTMELQHMLTDAEQAIDLNRKKRTLCLRLSGRDIDHILATTSYTQSKFLSIACGCSVVLACSLNPQQKSLLVKLVRRGITPSPATLAIGDGTNDVRMLQSASIGVAVSQNSNSAAALASDYVIPEFQFLTRLLLVHGRLNAYRGSRLILWSFFKSFCFTLPLCFYSHFSKSAGTSLYDTYMYFAFSVIFTSLPAIIASTIDADLPDTLLEKMPVLYTLIRRRTHLNFSVFFVWMIEALLFSIVIYFYTYFPFTSSNKLLNGQVLGLYSFGICIYLYVIIVVNLKLLLQTRRWSLCYTLSVFVLSLGLPWPLVMLHRYIDFPTNYYERVPQLTLSWIPFWIVMPVLLTSCYLIGFLLRLAYDLTNPNLSENLRNWYFNQIHMKFKMDDIIQNASRRFNPFISASVAGQLGQSRNLSVVCRTSTFWNTIASTAKKGSVENELVRDYARRIDSRIQFAASGTQPRNTSGGRILSLLSSRKPSTKLLSLLGTNRSQNEVPEPVRRRLSNKFHSAVGGELSSLPGDVDESGREGSEVNNPILKRDNAQTMAHAKALSALPMQRTVTFKVLDDVQGVNSDNLSPNSFYHGTGSGANSQGLLTSVGKSENFSSAPSEDWRRDPRSLEKNRFGEMSCFFNGSSEKTCNLEETSYTRFNPGQRSIRPYGESDIDSESDAGSDINAENPTGEGNKNTTSMSNYAESGEPTSSLKKDKNVVVVSDLIDSTTLKFKNQQLEADYAVRRRQETRRYALSYRVILLLLNLHGAGFVAFQTLVVEDGKKNTPLSMIFLIIPTLALFLLLLISLTNNLFIDKFDMIMGTFLTLYVGSKTISDFIDTNDGVLIWTTMPVLIFVVLRVPFRHALIYNIICFFLFVGRYFLSYYSQTEAQRELCSCVSATLDPFRTQKADCNIKDSTNIKDDAVTTSFLCIWSLVSYLPLLLGIAALTGFVGYRLEHSQRKQFLLDYQVETNRKKQREILNTMLPSFVVDQMLGGHHDKRGIPKELIAEDRGTMTLIFCDVYDFLSMVAAMEPTQLVKVLDSLFLCFDRCAEQFGCTKVETVFESYVAAAGLQQSNHGESYSHISDAFDAVEMSLAILHVTLYIVFELAHIDTSVRSEKEPSLPQATEQFTNADSTKFPNGNPGTQNVQSTQGSLKAETQFPLKMVPGPRQRLAAGAPVSNLPNSAIQTQNQAKDSKNTDAQHNNESPHEDRNVATPSAVQQRFNSINLDNIFQSPLNKTTLELKKMQGMGSQDLKSKISRYIEETEKCNVVDRNVIENNLMPLRTDEILQKDNAPDQANGPSQPGKQTSDEHVAEKEAKNKHLRRIRVKIGINSGRVVTGVVGAKKPQYALFGDTINTASRMKSSGEPDHIHISQATYDLVKNDEDLVFEKRSTEIKGKGLMDTYLLVRVIGCEGIMVFDPPMGRNSNSGEALSFRAEKRRWSTGRLSKRNSPQQSIGQNETPQRNESNRGLQTQNAAYSQPQNRLAQMHHPSADIQQNPVKSLGTQPNLNQSFAEALGESLEKTAHTQNSHTFSFLSNDTSLDFAVAEPKDSEAKNKTEPLSLPGDKESSSLFESEVKIPSSYRTKKKHPKDQVEEQKARNKFKPNINHGRLFEMKKKVDDMSAVSECAAKSSIAFSDRNPFSNSSVSRVPKKHARHSFTSGSDSKQSKSIDGGHSCDHHRDSECCTSESRFKIHWIFLTFIDKELESKFKHEFYSNKTYINTVEQALVICLMTLMTHAILLLSVDRVLGNGVHVEANYATTWIIRSIFCIALAVLWVILRYRHHPPIANLLGIRWLLFLLNLCIIAAALTFALSSAWAYRYAGEKPEWLYIDAIEMFFYITILHHNSGLLFQHCLYVDALVLSVTVMILVFVAQKTDTSYESLFMLPVFTFANMLSAYFREYVDRISFVVDDDMQITEARGRELLGDMLPRQVLEEYQQDTLRLAYIHENLTFLFADICGFTSWAKSVEARQVVSTLQELFGNFDRGSTLLGIYKLCTIGDAYVAVSEPLVSPLQHEKKKPDKKARLPDDIAAHAVRGAQKVVQLGRLMLDVIEVVREGLKVPNLNMRIGLHFGSCVGGIIGSGRIRYDLWGLDVVTGNMIESNGVPGRLCASQAFKDFVDEYFPTNHRLIFTHHKDVWIVNRYVTAYVLGFAVSPPQFRDSFHDPTKNSGKQPP